MCILIAKDNPELRGKGGCWGIVNHVGEFSCTVTMWDGEYTVGLQHLKSYDYLAGECQQMQEISNRIGQVYSDLLEETGINAYVSGIDLSLNSIKIAQEHAKKSNLKIDYQRA